MSDPGKLRESDVTDEALYLSRRQWVKRAGLFTLTGGAWAAGLVGLSSRGSADPPPAPPPKPVAKTKDGRDPWAITAKRNFAGKEARTPFSDVTTYNNFYEFGLRKSDPARRAKDFVTKPWTVTIEGACHKPQTIGFDDLVARFDLEERIYRMRCVEAWSMVIPWLGFPLAKLLELAQPTGDAKHVQFETLHDPKRMPGQNENWLAWPYKEGLRLDEAMHPLTLLSVGLYGSPLLGQNGAPIRLVVPWKYGFKGIKSITTIRLMRSQPITTWNRAGPAEYGYYANVNPSVAHPRWSQATERRIGELGRRDTLPFNGYAKDVAHLYKGMDLERFY